MIISLTVIALAFIWLLYESDWMRVRLPVGAITQHLEPTMTVAQWLDACQISPWTRFGYDADKPYPITRFEPDTKPIKLYKSKGWGGYIYITRKRVTPNNGFYPSKNDLQLSVGIDKPICGWTWLLRHSHPQVIHQFSIEAHGCRFTTTVNPDAHNGRIIKEVSSMALNKLSRRNGHQPKRSKGLTFNPNYHLDSNRIFAAYGLPTIK